MDVKEFTKEHQKDVLEEARKCALATVHEIYEAYEDHHMGLSDIDIDKVRDSLQTLMYIRNLNSGVQTS